MASSATGLVPPGQGYTYNYNQAGHDGSPASSTAHLQSTSGTYAATQPQSPANETTGVLLERSEIDKSIKALENLVTVLYDYAQLAASLAGMDKKLTKALKEASSMKRGAVAGDASGGAVEWPCNLFQTASNLLEAQTNLNAAYSKIVEKEYESTTSELKKWLKKLKKEDKGLDEYTTAANAKIKSAGIAYQKSVGQTGGRFKKSLPPPSPTANSNGALDNYTNILSTLTTSINNAKHQHALFISSRHVSVLFSISGSIGRIADAHWQRTTELIRRSAQYVGVLGQGRAFVEGGWRGGSTAADLYVNLPVADTDENEYTQRPEDITRKYEHSLASDKTPVPTVGRNAASASQTTAQSPSVATKVATPKLPPTALPSPPAPGSESKAAQSDVMDKIANEIRTSLGYSSNSTALETKKEESKEKDVPKDEPTPKAKHDDGPARSEPNTNSTGTFTSGTTRTTVSREPESSSSSDSPFVGTDTKPEPKPTLSESPMTMNAMPAPTTMTRDKSGTSIALPAPPTLPPLDETTIFQPTKALARTPAATATPALSVSPTPILNSSQDTPAAVFAATRTLARTPMDANRDSGPVQSPATGTKSPPVLSPLNTGGRDKADGETYFSSVAAATSNGMTRDGPNPPSSYGNGPYSPGSVPRPEPKPFSRVGRTMSIDSTTSNGSLVAAMRERYNAASPPLGPGPPPLSPQQSGTAGFLGRDRDRYNIAASPPPGAYAPRDPYGRRESDRERPRDWDAPPRGTGRVSDMASRFTPVEGPPPDNRYSQDAEGRYSRPINPHAQSDTLPIRSPLPVRRSMDEFGVPNIPYEARKGPGLDTMPTPERRGTMPVGVGLGIGTTGDRGFAGVGSGMAGVGAGNAAGGASYDIHLSELELQQKEMELQFQRQRLQLVKEREREALNAREKDNVVMDGGSERDFHRRDARLNRDNYADGYARDRERDRDRDRDRDGGYESATSGRSAYGGVSFGKDVDSYRSDRYGTPPVGTLSHRGNDYLDRRPVDFDDYASVGSGDYRRRGHNDIDSARLAPGRGYHGSHSRENINYANDDLLPPPSLHQSTRASSPRRSFEAGLQSPNAQEYSEAPRAPATRDIDPPTQRESQTGPVANQFERVEKTPLSPSQQSPQMQQTKDKDKDKEREKGGTWLGKGLKRLSMPLGASSNTGPTGTGTAGKRSFERRDT